MIHTSNAKLHTLVAVIVAVAAAGGNLAAQPAAGGATAVRAAIDATNKKFVDAFTKRDAAAMVAVYTEDGVAFPAHSDMVKGRPELQKMWQSVIDTGIATFALDTAEVEADGNLAYEVGTYVMKGRDGQVADRGKYCVIWKRVKGEWLLHRDIWTTSMPEASK